MEKHLNMFDMIEDVEIDVLTAICVIGQIQLASRHHLNKGESKRLAIIFARQLQERVNKIKPEYAVLIEMGWNPDFDL